LILKLIYALLVGATVDFERQLQNKHLLSIKEGQSLQLCVAVVSGSLPYEELFTITTDSIGIPGRKKRGGSPPASMILYCCNSIIVLLIL
jgi:hypothetical protein